MNRVWKIAVVHDTRTKGLGGHGTHLAFCGLPNVEIAALADSNEKDIKARMRETRASRHYRDYREMFDREKPDIAILCSRLPKDHFEQIRTAAERGIHVLCEKPMTTDLREADVIVSLAERHRVKIAVAHLARHAQVFQTAKQMIASGEIGRPLTFYGRGKEDARGGGEDTVVLGTHILDIGCHFFGKPESVFAEVSTEGRPLRRDDRSATQEPLGAVAGDSVFAIYRFPNEVRGIFESRKGLFKKQVRMGISVVGTEGVISVRYDDVRALRLSRTPYPPEDEAAYVEIPLHETRSIPGAEPLGNGTGAAPPNRYFAENNRWAAWDLMRAIEANRKPLTDASDAQTTVEMINGIYASQLLGRVIPFPLASRTHPLEAP